MVEQWDAIDRSTPGALLKGVAMAIASSVGGVSGAIWGTAFLRASVAAGPRTELTAADVVAMARAAIEGMKKRGQSDVGDKTLLDAFVPAVDEFERLTSAGASPGTALRAAAVVARAKTEEIKPWIAKRGRASYTGERSCNTYDAGSVAVAIDGGTSGRRLEDVHHYCLRGASDEEVRERSEEVRARDAERHRAREPRAPRSTCRSST